MSATEAIFTARNGDLHELRESGYVFIFKSTLLLCLAKTSYIFSQIVNVMIAICCKVGLLFEDPPRPNISAIKTFLQK